MPLDNQTKENPVNGIFFIVYGKKSLCEFMTSLESVRTHMPGTPVAAIVDQRLENLFRVELEQVYFHQMPEQWTWKIKVDFINRLPYEKSIFLDTDTIICDDLSDLYNMLDRVDIALCHEPMRTWGHEFPNLPDSFPMLNTGVIAFKKSSQINQLFHNWRIAHEILDNKKENNPRLFYTDQNSFRYALYNESSIRYSILPPEYNCRVSVGYIAGKVKVIHAHTDLHKVERIINASCGERLHGSLFGRVFFVIARRKIWLTTIRYS